jgi:predicted regulator of Ras-like GTPase activity (Roadblock/LC7/MglB family)
VPTTPTLGYDPHWEPHLQELLKSSAGVEGALVVTQYGTIIMGVFAQTIDADRCKGIAPRLASSLSLASELSQGSGRGKPKEIHMALRDGHLIMMGLGLDLLLTCILAPTAKLGLVLLDMRRISPRVAAEGIIDPKPPKPLKSNSRPPEDN